MPQRAVFGQGVLLACTFFHERVAQFGGEPGLFCTGDVPHNHGSRPRLSPGCTGHFPAAGGWLSGYGTSAETADRVVWPPRVRVYPGSRRPILPVQTEQFSPVQGKFCHSKYFLCKGKEECPPVNGSSALSPNCDFPVQTDLDWLYWVAHVSTLSDRLLQMKISHSHHPIALAFNALSGLPRGSIVLTE